MSKIEGNEQTPLMLLKGETQLDTAIKAVAKIEEVETMPVKEPLEEVESSLADFVQKSMTAVLAGNQLSTRLEQSLIDGLDSMSTEEKITLYQISQTTHADLITRLLNPTLTAIDSAKQAHAPKDNKNGNTAVQVNIGTTSGDSKIAEQVTPEVASGLNTLHMLIQALSQNTTPTQE